MKISLVLLLGTVTLLNSPGIARAQNYSLSWAKIGGGGGMQSTGGVYQLSGTIAQTDAGRVAATNTFRLEGGFWAIALQQLGYPQLVIARVGTNAIVTWSTPEPGLILQTASTLATSTVWSDLAGTPTISGTTNSTAVPLNSAAKSFFRLRRP